MKTSLKQVPSRQFPRFQSTQAMICAAVLALTGGAMTAHAQAPVVKANSYTSLTTGSDWVGSTAPGANNIAVWNGTASTPLPEPLGASTTWEGIQIVNPGGTITVSADGNTLTNGAVGVVGLKGIDMSTATHSLLLSNSVVLNGVQNWVVGSGQTLTLNGLLSRNVGSAARIYLADATSFVTTTNGSVATSLTASPNAILGSTYGNVFFSTLNDTDYVAEVATSTNFMVVPGVTVNGVYTPNPAGATPTDAGSVVLVDFNNQGSYGIRLGNTRTYNGIRFNMPQTNTAEVFNGQPSWMVNIPSGRTMTINSILVTTNVGNSPVLIDNGGFSGGTTGFTRIGNGGTQDLLIFQNNPAAPLIFQSNMGISQQGTGSLTKMGAGLVQLQTGSSYAGGTRVYEGVLEIDGSGTVGTNTINVYGGAFAQGNSATNSAPAIFFSGATNNIGVNAANGQCVDASTVTFNGGNSLQFLYSNTIAPSTTTAALLLTNLNGLTLNGPIGVSVLSGNFSLGQFPLMKYNGTVGGAGYAAISGLTLPPHIFGYLSNNVVNSSIDLVVTNVDLPLIWNAASGSAWDIANSANWLDQFAVSSTYQQLGSLGDSVVFNDSAPGPSITVALNTTVVPASVTVSNVNNTYTISGTGNISGLGSVTKKNSGILTLSTANSFTGGLNLNGGTVIFSALANLGAANINFGGGALQYNGNSDDISVRTVNFNAGGGTINTAGSTVTYANPVGNGGAGGLTKAGSGTLTLTGTNTYHGNTVVSQGTLALAAGTYLTNSPSIVLSSGAVLDTTISSVNLLLSAPAAQSLAGMGQVNGTVTVPSLTTINPGGTGPTGTLNVNGGLVINGGAINIDLAPTSNDLIAVTGPLTLNGGTLNLNLIGTVPLGRYVVITYTSGQLNGGVGSIPPPQISQPNTIATLDESVAGQIAIVLAQSASDVLTWPGTGSTWDTASPDWLKGGLSWIYTNGDSVTFNDSETGGNVSPSLTSSVLPSLVTVSNTVVPVYTFANGGGAIGGNASLVKDGTGALVMDTPNSYFGTTTIKNGMLQIGNGGLGDIGRGNVTNNGSLLFAEGDNGSHFVGGVISGTGSLTVNAPGSAVILTNNNTYSGLTTISNGTLEVGFGSALGSLGSNNNVTNNGVLLINRSGAVSLTANVTGSGSLQNTGPGTVTLSGTLSYLGDSSFSNGLVKVTANNQLPNANRVAGSTGILNLDGGLNSAATLDMNGFDVTVNGLSGQYNAFNSFITNSATKTNFLIVMDTLATTNNGQIMDRGTNAAGGRTVLFLTASTNSLTLNPTNANNFGGGIIVSNSTLVLGTPGAAVSVNINESQLAPGSGPITLLGTNTQLQTCGYTGSTTPTYTPLTNTIILPVGQTVSIGIPQRGDCNSTLLGGGTLNYIANYVRGGVGGNWAGFTGTITMVGSTSGGNAGFGDTNAGAIGLPNASLVMVTNVQFHPGSLTFGGNAYPATTIFPIGALSGGDSSVEITGNEVAAGNNSGSANAILTIGGLNTNCTYSGGIIDGQALTKVGTATFTLDCGSLLVTNVVLNGLFTVTNIGFEAMLISYTGVTTVSNGVLALDAPVNVTNSTNVVIASPAAVLDASDMGYVSNLANPLPSGATQELVINSIFEVVTNQSMGGVGTLKGFLQTDPGSILNVGLPTGALNVSSNASLAGIVNINLDNTNAQTCGELVSPGITVNPTATLVVTNIGPGLLNGASFTLFNHPVSGFASVTLPPKDPTGASTYIWKNNLAVNGSITLTNGGILPASPAKFTSISVNGLALTLTATNGAANGTYRLLESTNLLLPLAQWTPVLTNSFDGSGNLNLTTNVVTPGKPQMFYLLLMP